MKQLGFIFSVCILLFLSSFHAEAQQNRTRFEVFDTIPIRAGANQYRLFRLASKWLETERGTRLVARSFRDRQLAGKGYFIYHNRVRLPDVFLGPRANERTQGSIVFNIHIHIQDSIIVVKFFDFVHEAAFSEYGSMSFGRLMNFDRVPPGRCMEIEEWCDAVWADMKFQSERECKLRSSRMIPIVLIRRRTFRAREEVVEQVEEVVVDPGEYLKIERYIIHDKQESRRAPVVQQEVAEPQSDESAVSQPEAPAELPQRGRRARQQDDDDGDDENDPVVTQKEEPASQSKEKKEKKEKVTQEKQPKQQKAKPEKKKKSSNDDDDYYDDDDDYDDDDY
jgi:hypothetical protein